MTKAADELRKNAKRVQASRRGSTETAATAEAPPKPGTKPTPVRTQRVRRTVDLTTNTHRQLGRWSDETADELGLTRVTSQDVLSALVDELLASDDLQAAVRRRIAQTRS